MLKWVGNHPGFEWLNENQKKMIGEVLTQIVINKQHTHESDLAKASALFYKVAESGYLIFDSVIVSILKDTKKNWSDTVIKDLCDSANVANNTLAGLFEIDYSEFTKNLKLNT